MKTQIGYSLSPLAHKYIEYKRAITMVRDPERTCSPHVLEQLLERHGLPVSPEVIDFEENLGGWCSSHALSAHGFGVYLSLQDGVTCSAVANEFRSSTWLFEGDREALDEDGEYSPLWGTGYPRAFFQDRVLIPVGMRGLDEFFFIGLKGEIYDWISPLDKLVLDAGSGRTLIESSGLLHHRGNRKWFEVHICADVSAIVCKALTLPRYEPACDHLFQWWASDTTHVRLVPDYAPCIMGTYITCEHETDFINVMELIRETLKVKRVRIWRGANAVDDYCGVHLLQQFGIDYEEFCGPGLGHSDSQYDVSLCDPKNWT